MPWDADKFIPAKEPQKAAQPDELAPDRERRRAARRFFRAAPPVPT
jgi:hypothetical protein